MRCYIGYSLPNEFGEIYRDLVAELGDRFGLSSLIAKARFPHVTLKSPFDTTFVDSLDRVLADFSSEQRFSHLTINGFGYFDRQVVYAAIEPSPAARATHAKLLELLRAQVHFSQFDNALGTWHVTIAKGAEMNGRFEEIGEYLKGIDFRHELDFDNLTLFEKRGGRTRIYQTYRFGG